MQKFLRFSIVILFTSWAVTAEASTAGNGSNAPSAGWLSQPLSLADALNFALQQNALIREAQKDVEATLGISIQTRAIALPKLQATGNFNAVEPSSIEQYPFGLGPLPLPPQNWNTGVRITQSIYEGGRIVSAIRTSRLLREQALASYQTVVADTLLEVRTTYYDVLLTEELIRVQEASVALLEGQLKDARSRFEAGAVPQFNVLRAEVEVANAHPRLIRARNAFRITKQNLAHELGFSIPGEILEDIPLRLTDTLRADPFSLNLTVALTEALKNRPELESLRKAAQIRSERVKEARAGYKPSIQLFAGYGTHSSSFTNDLSVNFPGWLAGAQVTWNIFDGDLTRGRVAEAQALYERSQIELEDQGRRVELEVRRSYSNFIDAREVLASQEKVSEQAEEAFRLATARFQAGSGTQLDVLSAQTALTDARSTKAQALREYNVALGRLQRAIGYPPNSELPPAIR